MNVLIQNAESTRTAKASNSAVDKLGGKLGNLWCALMHDSPGWPIHGHYTCHACGRRHLVKWEREQGPLTSPAALKNAGLPTSAEHLSSALAVLPNSATAFAGVQSIPRMEHRLRASNTCSRLTRPYEQNRTTFSPTSQKIAVMWWISRARISRARPRHGLFRCGCL
jgi:hypothetical protein